MAVSTLAVHPVHLERRSSTEPIDHQMHSLAEPATFDPSKHLDYVPPASVLRMPDLDLEPTPLSDLAATAPFQLLSHDAILEHRRELFSAETLKGCLHRTRPGSCCVRGAAPRYAPFVHQFWHSPEVLRIVSEHAGIELVPAMDYEICHTNVQLGPGGLDAVRATPVEPPRATADEVTAFEGRNKDAERVSDRNTEIVHWHKDSHPFVCVVMLSDARYMNGGETELETGIEGKTLKVKAPQMGSAIVMQGRYIKHIALPTTNMPERITIVTSFRPKNPSLLDETTNMNVRDKSHLTELYYQWTTYRLSVLSERARLAAETLRERYRKNTEETDREGRQGMCMVETVNVEEVEKWVREQMAYMEATLYEMRPLENGR